MKKCCKNANILADDFIEDSIYEALDEKWKRSDVAKYLHGRTSSMSLQAMKRLLRDTDERDLMVSGLVHTVAESLRYEIQNRELKVEPIQYGWRRDGINGKLREIGVESVKQLILDEIASEGLDELWRRKLGYHQYASIKGKGQLGGKRAIEHQIRKKYAQSRYAWKGDVRKCYPSVDTRKLKRMLEHDVKNEVLLYLVFFLIGHTNRGLILAPVYHSFCAIITCLKPMCMYLAYIRPESTEMVRLKARDLYFSVYSIWTTSCS